MDANGTKSTTSPVALLLGECLMEAWVCRCIIAAIVKWTEDGWVGSDGNQASVTMDIRYECFPSRNCRNSVVLEDLKSVSY